MSANQACDVAIARAMADDPELEQAIREAEAAQSAFNDASADAAYRSLFDSDIPNPSQMKSEVWDAQMEQAVAQQTRMGRATEVVTDRAKTAWDSFKQARVALMLSNPLTHIKNIAATGGQAVVVRPFEESMGILFSRVLKGHEARSYKEMYHYGSGMMRAAMDAPSIMKSLGKIAGKKGAFATTDVEGVLRGKGYAPELAHGKADIILDPEAAQNMGQFSEGVMARGVNYLFNAAFGSQFSGLQGADVAFKMVSHRAKVQQLLSRQGMREGHMGEALDEYVASNWQRMSDDVRAGRVSDDMNAVEASGIEQAAEDTFTQTPQTDLGRLMAGHFDTSTGWKKAASESMQIIAPFRSIYVNLMRQTISRRLMPRFDKKTMAELRGLQGNEARELALARTAGAWTLFAGTSALLYQTGAKLHGPDELAPEIRDMQFQMHGKVGNTIQMGDQYIPLDMLPPSIGVPLGYAATTLQALEELPYRYTNKPEEDQHEVFLKGFAPLIGAMVDGPWVTEYMNFISRTNSYLQYGNIQGFGEYVADLTVSPMKMPKWISELTGGDPYMKTTDGIVNKFKMDMMGDVSAYGHKRNMFGRRIMPLERFGDNSEYPWYGGDSDVTDFLKATEYDKIYPRNLKMSIRGDGKGENKVPPGYDDIQMDGKMRDKFEYYVGQSRVSGKTLAEDLRDFMHSPGIYDPKTGRIIANRLQVQEAVKKIHYQHRKIARQLLKFNPEFGIREKQIETFVEGLLKNGGTEQEAQMYRQQQYQALNGARTQLARFF